MKITIKGNKQEEVKAGDFLLVQDEWVNSKIRQIIYDSGLYKAIAVEDGSVMKTETTIDDLIEYYSKSFDSITVVKNKDVELIVGGNR